MTPTGMSSLTVQCWNCRGLSTAVPYIQEMMSEGPGVLVISEHWLWPYELHKLNDISEDLFATGKSDSRLGPEAEGGRGCGGVGIVAQVYQRQPC